MNSKRNLRKNSSRKATTRKGGKCKSLRGGAPTTEQKLSQSYGLKPLSKGQLIRRIDDDRLFSFNYQLVTLMNGGFISGIEDKFKELDALVSGLEAQAPEQEPQEEPATKGFLAVGLKPLSKGQLIRRIDDKKFFSFTNQLAEVINNGLLGDIDDNFKKLDSRLTRLEAAAPSLPELTNNANAGMTPFQRRMAAETKALLAGRLKPLSKGQVIRRVNDRTLISFTNDLVRIINGGVVSDIEDKFKMLEARLKRLSSVEGV